MSLPGMRAARTYERVKRAAQNCVALDGSIQATSGQALYRGRGILKRTRISLRELTTLSFYWDPCIKRIWHPEPVVVRSEIGR